VEPLREAAFWKESEACGQGRGIGKDGEAAEVICESKGPVLPGPVPEPNSVSSLRTATRCCLHGGATRPVPLGDPGLRETPPFGPGKAPNSPFANVEWLRHGGGLTPCPTRHRRRAPRGLGLRCQRDGLWTCHRHENHSRSGQLLVKAQALRPGLAWLVNAVNKKPGRAGLDDVDQSVPCSRRGGDFLLPVNQRTGQQQLLLAQGKLPGRRRTLEQKATPSYSTQALMVWS
jgi:hypothetical protein